MSEDFITKDDIKDYIHFKTWLYNHGLDALYIQSTASDSWEAFMPEDVVISNNSITFTYSDEADLLHVDKLQDIKDAIKFIQEHNR